MDFGLGIILLAFHTVSSFSLEDEGLDLDLNISFELSNFSVALIAIIFLFILASIQFTQKLMVIFMVDHRLSLGSWLRFHDSIYP
jgi:hypothetical protein